MADSVDCLLSNSQEPYRLEVRLGQLTQRLHSHQQQYLAIEDHGGVVKETNPVDLGSSGLSSNQY